MAYFTAPGYYNIIREMPAGKGFADFVFILRTNAGFRPAMVVELKYNQSTDTALKQIKEKDIRVFYLDIMKESFLLESAMMRKEKTRNIILV